MKKTIHIHLEELEQLSGGKKDFIIRMLDVALQNTPGLLENLNTAVNTGNNETINAAAHRLRPTFHYLGRMDICNLLDEIEHTAAQMDTTDLKQKTEMIVRESVLIFEEVKNKLAELRE